MSDKPIIGISHGDINGIGYEIIMKGLADPRIYEMCIPVVYGSPKVAVYHRKALDLNNFQFVGVKNADSIQHKKPNLINVLDDNVRVELGKSTVEAGQSSIISLNMAVNDLRMGKIDALLTCPINKKNIQQAGFEFYGHTEYLQTQFDADEVLMLMVADNFRLGVATGHVPLSKVPELLTTELILSKLKIMNQTLIRDFGISRPHIAVLGLNPHAGEQGILGSEDDEKIVPALNKARENGIMALGPFSADGFFGAASYKKFDGILAMYHDQGLIPFKTIAFENGVNYTAGLPIVRTSPAHGTAFDITGKNICNKLSFLHAIYLAIDVISNRKNYDNITKNPLKKQQNISAHTPDLYIDEIEVENF